MRPVARYQLQLQPGANIAASSVLVRETIESWLASKATHIADIVTPRRDVARDTPHVMTRQGAVGSSHAWGYSYREPTDFGHFETIIDVVETSTTLSLDVVLRAEQSAHMLAPQRIDVFRPMLIARLFATPPLAWHYGPSPLLNAALTFSGESDGRRLAKILLASDRRTPIIVVSEDNLRVEHSRQFASTIHDDLVGMCLVASCDSDASWELSSQVATGLGVYGGAVRLYWPGMKPTDKKWSHPLFLLPRGPDIVDDDWWRVASATRSRLRRIVFGVSAFSATASESATSIYRQAESAHIERQRAALLENSDYVTLAESYASENKDLKAERDKLKDSLGEANDKIASLTVALAYRDTDSEEEAPDVAPQVEPLTIEDAVGRAKQEFQQYLTFGDDLGAAITTLRADAGPPGRILDYLEALAHLAMDKRRGALGKTDLRWLQDRNVEASQESDTIRHGKEMRRRRFPIEGNAKQFDLHLKPADATSPDRCVRIYFHWNDTTRKIEIGYIGRHL